MSLQPVSSVSSIAFTLVYEISLNFFYIVDELYELIYGLGERCVPGSGLWTEAKQTSK